MRTRADAKTLIPNARTQSARFLGDAVVQPHADDKPCRTPHRRGINGAPGLQMPEAVIRATCAQETRRGTVSHLAARLQEADDRIVTQDQAASQRFVQDSVRADHVHRRWRAYRIMPLSLVFSRAPQDRTRAGTIFRQDKATGPRAHGTRQVREARPARGGVKAPRGTRCGGIARRWQKQAIRNEEPTHVDSHRRAVVQRLLAQACERCGAPANGAGHHIRQRADLSTPGRREKPLWVRRMAARRRKTLVTCQRCHEAMHRERPAPPHVTASITGAPRAIESLRRGAEGGCWTRAFG
jgi:hypothetical protein